MEDLIQTLYESHIQQLTKLGIEGDQAAESALQLLKDIEQRHGGDEYYVPKCSRIRKAYRDRHINQEWRKGKNRAHIAERYGVSKSTVNRAIEDSLSSPPPEWYLK